MGLITLLISMLITLLASILDSLLLHLNNLFNFFIWLLSFDYSKKQHYFVFINHLVDLYLPYLLFIVLLALFKYSFKKAKQQKAGVLLLASFIQMFLPDPFAERTVKVVQVQKEKKPAKKIQTHEDNE